MEPRRLPASAEYVEAYGIAEYAQEMLTLLTLHRPDDPLGFIESCLGEMSAGVNPLIHAYHMLRLTQHQSHSVFMDQLADAYCALAHRKGKSFITADEMLLLTTQVVKDIRVAVKAADPACRITAAAALRHPFFDGVDRQRVGTTPLPEMQPARALVDAWLDAALPAFAAERRGQPCS